MNFQNLLFYKLDLVSNKNPCLVTNLKLRNTFLSFSSLSKQWKWKSNLILHCTHTTLHKCNKTRNINELWNESSLRYSLIFSQNLWILQLNKRNLFRNNFSHDGLILFFKYYSKKYFQRNLNRNLVAYFCIPIVPNGNFDSRTYTVNISWNRGLTHSLSLTNTLFLTLCGLLLVLVLILCLSSRLV